MEMTTWNMYARGANNRRVNIKPKIIPNINRRTNVVMSALLSIRLDLLSDELTVGTLYEVITKR